MKTITLLNFNFGIPKITSIRHITNTTNSVLQLLITRANFFHIIVTILKQTFKNMQSIQWLFNCHVVYCEQPYLLLCATFLGSITINNRPNVIIRRNKPRTLSSLSIYIACNSMYCVKETSRTLCACVIVVVVVAIFQPCISSTNNVIFNVDTPSIANHYPEHRWWMILLRTLALNV